MPASPRLLFLMSPGRQARMYLIGLVAAARSMGLPNASLELGPIWDHARAHPGSPAAADAVARDLAALVERERITHVLGYGYNGVELGRVHTETSNHEPLLASLGVRHLMLWTDHPNWMADGIALHPVMRRLLAHGRHAHFLKSDAAAREASDVLGWPNVFPLAMAEAYDLLPPAPRTDAEPPFDMVAIVGGVHALPPVAAARLADDDPDPAAIDQELRAPALDAGASAWADPGAAPALGALLAAKVSDPTSSLHRLSRSLSPAHAAALAPLRRDPARWYATMAGLRRAVSWRRDFWVAWLARRARVGVFGCDASALGIEQAPAQRDWVPYARQPEVYAQGCGAINTNAAHDEEGCTHKPFQIAASGAACVHHATRGLSALFTPGEEILPFSRGPELLAHARALRDRARRESLGGRMLARARQDHTWACRLEAMLRLAPGA